MLVDTLDIEAKAGTGGDGVVRWLRLKYQPKAGPAGGNGGKGGDVFVRGVRNLSLLSKYTGSKTFFAKNGEHGRARSQFGKGSNDLYIDVPIGSTVTHLETGRVFTIEEEGQIEKILRGGRGGLGNEQFKSSTNRSPEQATKGEKGEQGTFRIELALTADVGLVGLPNAGKSTLLNLLTNATSSVGAYPFTTLEPHLGDFYTYVIADIPGLIEGAADGKGLGHKFLRHVSKTTMLLHLVSLADEHPYNNYVAINKELSTFDTTLVEKEQWIVLTKADLVTTEDIKNIRTEFDKTENRVFIIAENDPESIKNLADALIQKLRGE